MLLLNALIWGIAVWLTVKLVYKKNRTLNRIILFGLFLIFLSFGSLFIWQRTIPSSIQDSSVEEISFIDCFLETCFRGAVTNGAALVINDTLSLKGITSGGRDVDELEKSLIRSQHRKRVKEAIRDLFRKNATDCEFDLIGTPSPNHVLLSAAELDAFFHPGKSKGNDGWEMFYDKHPDSPGIISLSRVGFSRDGSVAVIYMGNTKHWLAGHGSLRVFEKINGKWKENRHSPIGPRWVS
jgi:hypothetical protein